MKKIFFFSLVCLTLSACSSQVNYTANSTTRPPRAKECDISIYLPDTPLNKPYEVIGSLLIGDSGFSVDCGQATVLKQVKEQGCLAGADAVLLTEIKEPDWISTCYRVRGSMVVFTPSLTAPKIADDQVEAAFSTDSKSLQKAPPDTKKLPEAEKLPEESIDYVPIPFD